MLPHGSHQGRVPEIKPKSSDFAQPVLQYSPLTTGEYLLPAYSFPISKFFIFFSFLVSIFFCLLAILLSNIYLHVFSLDNVFVRTQHLLSLGGTYVLSFKEYACNLVYCLCKSECVVCEKFLVIKKIWICVIVYLCYLVVVFLLKNAQWRWFCDE